MGEREMQMDFYGDWVWILRQRLGRLGCRGYNSIPAERLPMVYFNVMKRLIDPQPRAINKSAEFSCPPHLQAGLQAFEEKMRKGENLTPHMSTTISAALFDDMLLNDWGIHHFHLGTKLRKNRFMSRTGPLLYAYVTDSIAYLLDVKGHDDFACSHLLEILHRNWPLVIAKYQMACQGMEYTPTDDEIRKLREGGWSYSLEMSDGTVYSPVGGGYASSGMSDEAIRAADYYSKCVRWFEGYIRESIEELARAAAVAGRPFGEKLKFKLGIKGEWFRAVERNSLIVFDLPRPGGGGVGYPENGLASGALAHSIMFFCKITPFSADFRTAGVRVVPK